MIDAASMPARIAALPRDALGQPIPWFAERRGYRVPIPGRFERALAGRRCWTCGTRLDDAGAFLIGPVGVIERVSLFPPSHRECALFAAQHCPLLEGTAVVWITRDYTLLAASGSTMIALGEPEDVRWLRGGEPIDRREAQWAILGAGVQAVKAARPKGRRAERDAGVRLKQALAWLPAAELEHV